MAKYLKPPEPMSWIACNPTKQQNWTTKFNLSSFGIYAKITDSSAVQSVDLENHSEMLFQGSEAV